MYKRILVPLDGSELAEGILPLVERIAKGLNANVHVLSVIGRAISDDHFAVVDAIADAGGGRAAIVNGGRSDVARSARGVLQDLEERRGEATLRPASALLTARDPLVLEALVRKPELRELVLESLGERGVVLKPGVDLDAARALIRKLGLYVE